MHAQSYHPTRALIDLGHLAHNLQLLRSQAGTRPVWPAIKANAYGHGASLIADQLVTLGVDSLCVAHVNEAIALIETGNRATFLVLSGAVPGNASDCVRYNLQPVVSNIAMVEALGRAASAAGRQIAVHVKVDTGMGRLGIAPQAVAHFFERCRDFPAVRVRGVMSHFACADEADKRFSQEQLARFRTVLKPSAAYGVPICHMANSAALFDLPDSLFDAVRPGIALYGLKPSATMRNPAVDQLRPVLSITTRITALKEVPADVGLSYGLVYRTSRPTLVATVPVGYGDGISRGLSGRMKLLVGGLRCPQIGRITMDQMLLDVSALRGKVEIGDEAVLIGSQADANGRALQTITADELAGLSGTINYEVVTAIADRVPRVALAAKPLR